MPSINNFLATGEQFLNPMDKIPVVSFFSGNVRVLAGCVEIVVAIFFGSIKALFGENATSYTIREGYIYTLHGVGNILRGCFCMIPIVNIGLYFYDKNVGRMNYEYETIQYNTYPWMTAHIIAKRY